MKARQKLNRAFLNGSFLLAGCIGAVTQSWAIFGLAFAGLVIGNVIAGDIRIGPKKRGRR